MTIIKKLVLLNLSFALVNSCYSNDLADIEKIQVSGSHYAIKDNQQSTYFLSEDTIDSMPHIADDIFRLMPAIPGVTSGDYSANFYIRGGKSDEVLVLLDGLELYRPFHMKSFNSAFSIVDTDNVASVNFSSGGYGAKYGDRLSGVLDITSITPSEERYTIGASFINSRISAQDSHENGTWLVSARRGYLDLVLEAVDDESSKFEPIYGDVFSKITYDYNEKHTLSINLLFAWDDEILDDKFTNWQYEKEWEVHEKIEGKYTSEYLWLTLDSMWQQELVSKTILAAGKIKEDRHGKQHDPLEVWLTLNDVKSFDFLSIQQDWEWLLNPHLFLQWGWQSKKIDAKYDYDMEAYYVAPYNGNDYQKRIANVDTSGDDHSIYLSGKWRMSPQLLTELGIRWDQQSYIGFKDDQISPRASVAYQLDDHKISLSWGVYHQAQDPLSLQIADGVTTFEQAQKAQHLVLGYQWALTSTEQLRVDIYQKDISKVTPWYENALGPSPFLPEGQKDRVLVAPEKAKISGIETTYSGFTPAGIRYQVSYTWSKAQDYVDDKWYERSWDQRHSINALIDYQFNNNWVLSAAFYYHTGWPITGESAYIDDQGNIVRQLNERNSEEFDDYHRLDLRTSKTYQLNNSELQVFFEVSNTYNRKNPCCIEAVNYQVAEDGQLKQKRDVDNWLPIIPSFGVKWTF